MKSLLRFSTVIIIPAIQVAIMLLSLRMERFYFSGAAVAFLLTDVLLVPYFTGKEHRSRLFALSFPPLALVLLAFGLFFFVEEEWLKHMIIIASALAQFLYIINLYHLVFRSDRYQERSFFHANSIVGTLIIFFGSACAYGSGTYIDIPVWFWIWPAAALMAALVAQGFWVHGISLRLHARHALVILLLGVEGAIAISLLPSLYLTSAALHTALFVTVLNLVVSDIRKELTRFEVIGSIMTALIMVALVLGTAPWR